MNREDLERFVCFGKRDVSEWQHGYNHDQTVSHTFLNSKKEKKHTLCSQSHRFHRLDLLPWIWADGFNMADCGGRPVNPPSTVSRFHLACMLLPTHLLLIQSLLFSLPLFPSLTLYTFILSLFSPVSFFYPPLSFLLMTPSWHMWHTSHSCSSALFLNTTPYFYAFI